MHAPLGGNLYIEAVKILQLKELTIGYELPRIFNSQYSIQSFMADSDVDYDVTFFTKSYHSYFWR